MVNNSSRLREHIQVTPNRTCPRGRVINALGRHVQ